MSGVALLSWWLGHWSLALALAHQGLGMAGHIWFCRRHGFTWYKVEDPERYVALSKQLVGYVAGVLLALSFLPQVVKTFRVKHADDVAMGMLLLSLGAAIGYEIYAWQLQLWPVLVMNGIFLVFTPPQESRVTAESATD